MSGDMILLRLVVEYERVCDLFCLKAPRHSIYREAVTYLQSKGLRL